MANETPEIHGLDNYNRLISAMIARKEAYDLAEREWELSNSQYHDSPSIIVEVEKKRIASEAIADEIYEGELNRPITNSSDVIEHPRCSVPKETSMADISTMTDLEAALDAATDTLAFLIKCEFLAKNFKEAAGKAAQEAHNAYWAFRESLNKNKR